MLKPLVNIFHIIIFSLLCFLSTVTYANKWTKIAPGIEYIDINDHSIINISHIHVFKINLKYNQLQLAIGKELFNRPAFIDEFAEIKKSLIAINGGFFDKSYQPLGLRISGYKLFNQIKGISWWGIFYINNNKASITNIENYFPKKGISFAIQSGPRLIIDGKIPSLKPGLAERTALGITKTGKIIIVVTNNNPLTTTALANIMKSYPLNCKNALNLDGGGSTQLYAKINNLKINVTGFSEVSDAIVVNSI
ncbi:MAG: hypothetical protein A3E88_06680 [Legionellales bacterium RIFCSPHIGHO2_12_FULL_35_11]|nr:MAG: hypothetical protein A3E88_06680 [Legionellales bacterium RIFCSPHIGHO2_12_FULL_35_11]